MKRVDLRIVEDLSREQPDYAPFIASRLGIRLKYIERRCDALVRSELLEQTNRGMEYRLTAQGEQYLEKGFDDADFDKMEE